VPHDPCRFPFNAWTSTSWPPEHGDALCGWLLPGPWSRVVFAAPFCIAIWPAVLPLPYNFVSSDEAAAWVSCAVSFAGFTPSCAVVEVPATVVDGAATAGA
jgi:hypothetical protein